MAAKPLPAPEVLRQLLRYEPDTGKLYWRERPEALFSPGGNTSAAHAAHTWNTKYAGQRAMTAPKASGHLSGPLLGRSLMAHRVAWAVHYGQWPNNWLDHINGVRDDNRISNLRIVDKDGNARNRRPVSTKASGLPPGVCIKHNAAGPRYFAQIQFEKKNNHLGYFDTPEAAHAAYMAKARELGFHENHGLRAVKAKGEAS